METAITLSVLIHAQLISLIVFWRASETWFK
jgi:hypothetical protein